MAHHVAMISNGKIIESGTPEDIRESKNPTVRRFVEGRAENNGPEKVPADLFPEQE